MKIKKILLPLVMLCLLAGAFVVPMFIVPEAKQQGEALGTFVSSKADQRTLDSGEHPPRPDLGPMVFPGDQMDEDVNLDEFFAKLNAHEFDEAEAFLKREAGTMSQSLASNLRATVATRRSEKGALKRTLDESKTLLAELRKMKNTGPAVVKQGPLPKGNLVTFEVDSSLVSPAAKSALASPAKVLKSRSDVGIVLRGYSDSTGDAKYNAILAEARCESVREVLLSLGAQSSRIRLMSFGESKNVDSKANKNPRKVEVLFEYNVQVTQSSNDES